MTTAYGYCEIQKPAHAGSHTKMEVLTHKDGGGDTQRWRCTCVTLLMGISNAVRQRLCDIAYGHAVRQRLRISAKVPLGKNLVT